jgi:hypothetical protein
MVEIRARRPLSTSLTSTVEGSEGINNGAFLIRTVTRIMSNSIVSRRWNLPDLVWDVHVTSGQNTAHNTAKTCINLWPVTESKLLSC